MDACPCLKFIIVNSKAHVDRYSIANWQVEESFLAISILANGRAVDSCEIFLNRVSLCIPAKGIGRHPRAVTHIFRMLLGLVRHGGDISFHSFIREESLTVAIVIDLTYIDSVLHLISGAAGP